MTKLNQPLNLNNLKQLVTAKITSGQVKMHSKTFFATGRVLSWLSGLLFSLLLILLTSFIVYVLRYNSLVFKGFGWSGLNIFLNSLPILALIIVTLLGLSLSLLAWRQTPAYKKPAAYTVGLTIVVSLIIGLAINLTPLHARLAEKAFNRQLPVLGPVYSQNLNGRWLGATAGTITDIQNNNWEIEDNLQTLWLVKISPTTRFPFDKDFHIGDKVIIHGPTSNQTIKAKGVRKIDDQEKINFPHMQNGRGPGKLRNPRPLPNP
ncbi:hypothetical protein KKC17_00850 [Patescibacteria group bacterium]|nr:hypothetical protein [Patescibacteria group bacterium]